MGRCPGVVVRFLLAQRRIGAPRVVVEAAQEASLGAVDVLAELSNTRWPAASFSSNNATLLPRFVLLSSGNIRALRMTSALSGPRPDPSSRLLTGLAVWACSLLREPCVSPARLFEFLDLMVYFAKGFRNRSNVRQV